MHVLLFHYINHIVFDLSTTYLYFPPQDPKHEDGGRQTGVQGSAGRYCEGCQERGILFAVEGIHPILLPVSNVAATYTARFTTSNETFKESQLKMRILATLRSQNRRFTP